MTENFSGHDPDEAQRLSDLGVGNVGDLRGGVSATQEPHKEMPEPVKREIRGGIAALEESGRDATQRHAENEPRVPGVDYSAVAHEGAVRARARLPHHETQGQQTVREALEASAVRLLELERNGGVTDPLSKIFSGDK